MTEIERTREKQPVRECWAAFREGWSTGLHHPASGTWKVAWSSPPGFVCMGIEYVMCVVCACMCVQACVYSVHACICVLFVCTYICVIPVTLSFKSQDIKGRAAEISQYWYCGKTHQTGPLGHRFEPIESLY